jgi:hypothetical protein
MQDQHCKKEEIMHMLYTEIEVTKYVVVKEKRNVIIACWHSTLEGEFCLSVCVCMCALVCVSKEDKDKIITTIY